VNKKRQKRDNTFRKVDINMIFNFKKRPNPMDEELDFDEEIAEEFDDFNEDYDIYGDNEEDL